MEKIYCISGLGSDKKIFAKIKVAGYELVHLNWLRPEINEPVASYAKRMSIEITDEQPLIIGLSFGGMIGIEIAKLLPVKKLILISSVKSHKEMPLWMKISGWLKLNKIIPMRPYKILEPLENYNMGVTDAAEKEMVRQYRKKVDRYYLNWAINTVLNWRNNHAPENVFHIHGSTDRIFPLKKIKADHIISGGGHFMVFNRASQVNESLKLILKPEA